jgi:hypothetical protein
MPVAVVCPSCQGKLRAPDKFAGRTVKCPRCGARIKVGEPLDLDDDERGEELDDSPAREKSGVQLWIVLPLAGLACVAVAVGVTIFVMKSGDKQLAQAPVQPPTNPPAVVTDTHDDAGKVTAKAPAVPATDKQGPAAEPPKTEQKPSEKKPPEQPYELKGDKLGMSLQDFKAKHRRTFNAGKVYEAPFCSDQRTQAEREKSPLPTLLEESWHPKANIVNARLTYPFEDFEENQHTPSLAGFKVQTHWYGFIDDRLYVINYLFPQTGFGKVQEAMARTYGKPSGVVTKEYQNAFGAKYTGVICVWDNGVSQIMLTERYTDLKTSNLMFLHEELGKLADTRREKFHKPGL